MPATYLRFIPDNPTFIPGSASRHEALRFLTRVFPDSDPREVITDGIQFVVQGENFESVICQACDAMLDVSWWSQVMDSAWDAAHHQFANLAITAPCCSIASSLNELHYVWLAGFAQFWLELIEPVDDGGAATLAALERILGCQLRCVWAR